MVWLTALLAACLAILPAMAARALTVALNIHDKHKVGLAYLLFFFFTLKTYRMFFFLEWVPFQFDADRAQIPDIETIANWLVPLCAWS